jgi:L-asparaginase
LTRLSRPNPPRCSIYSFKLVDAFEKTFGELKEFDGFAGAIAIDKFGNFHVQESHPKVVYGSFDGTVLTLFE